MADLMKDTYSYSDLKKKYGNFMSPVAKISISGTDMISSAKLKITDIQISMNLEVASSLTFTVHDIFDLKARTINAKAKSNFKLGNIVTASLGYGSATKDVFYGYIADVTTEFGNSPQIRVVALDLISLLMKRKRDNYAYQSKNYSEILGTIISEYPNCYKSKKIDKTDDSLEVPIQRDTDFDYIKKVICARTNKQFLVVAGDIYLRDYDDVSKPIMELEWGVSFLTFTERRKLVNEKYTVIGQEDQEKKVVTASEKAESSGLAAAFKGKPLEIVINDPSVKDADHAKLMASYHAKKSLVSAMSGRGSTIGLPEIVPGRYLKISNVGSKEEYYIKSVRHSYGEGGFTTEFEFGS